MFLVALLVFAEPMLVGEFDPGVCGVSLRSLASVACDGFAEDAHGLGGMRVVMREL